MNILDLLKDKKIKVKTDVGVDVELTIKNVEQENHSQDLEPATQANDWWPKSRDWTTYTIYFTNGYSKKYSDINDLEILN